MSLVARMESSGAHDATMPLSVLGRGAAFAPHELGHMAFKILAEGQKDAWGSTKRGHKKRPVNN